MLPSQAEPASKIQYGKSSSQGGSAAWLFSRAIILCQRPWRSRANWSSGFVKAMFGHRPVRTMSRITFDREQAVCLWRDLAIDWVVRRRIQLIKGDMLRLNTALGESGFRIDMPYLGKG